MLVEHNRLDQTRRKSMQPIIHDSDTYQAWTPLNSNLQPNIM